MRIGRLAGGACLVLALAAVSLAGDKAKAEKALKDAVAAKDADALQKACDELIEIGGVEPLGAILSQINKADPGSYWQLVGAASGFRDKVALEELGKQIVSKQGDARTSPSRDLVFALQNNHAEIAAIPLGIVLEKGKYDLQLMAADQLALMRCVESIDALIASLRREEKGDQDLRKRVEQSLLILIGEDKGDVANWEGWWKQQREKGVPERKDDDSGRTGAKPRDRELDKVKKALPMGKVVVIAARDEFSNEDPHIMGDNDFDHMQNVLKQLEIPHTVVSRKRFEESPDKFLTGCMAVLVNCHQINEFCNCPKCHPGTGGVNRLAGPCQDCNVHTKVCFRMKKPALDRLKTWVENEGGFLYTEDWGLVEVTGQLWPEYVASGAKDKPNLIRKKRSDGGFMAGFYAKLTPSRGNTSHPLMRGVWQRDRKPAAPKKSPLDPDDDPPAAGPDGQPGGQQPGGEAQPGGTTGDPAKAPPKGGDGKTGERPPPPPVSPAKKLEHRWLVDDESPTIEVKDTSKVISLLESEELAGIDGGFPVVAVTFSFGKPGNTPSGGARGTGEWAPSTQKGGRVLHTLSHFGHQSSDDDGQALHNLIINFLLEAQKHHEGAQAGKK